jgi:hypothetical protein
MKCGWKLYQVVESPNFFCHVDVQEEGGKQIAWNIGLVVIEWKK